jgi:nicotinate-nucleotide pyrophosphorylase (carboxylating)
VQRALDEDLGRAGDITSIATIPETAPARAILVARQTGVIAGLPLGVATFQKLSPDIGIQAHFRDGATVAAGVQVLTISGPARAVLAGERIALNFIGRLSGIATLTSDYVRHTAGTTMRICCTRKTTPGLRALEKYAVRCGGGFNHRFGLDDAILIKDNISRSPAASLRCCNAHAPTSAIWSRWRSRSIIWTSCAKCSTAASPTWCCWTIWISPRWPRP